MTPIRHRLEGLRDPATPRVALVPRIGAFVVLAFLCTSAISQAVDHKLHVPPEKLERLAGGEPLDIIVQFDDEAVRAEAARKRASRGIPHDDDGIRDEKARRYAEIKRRVLEKHQRNGLELRKDYRHLPMSQLRVGSRAVLDELLASPGVVAVYPEGEEQAFLAESGPLVREPQAFAAGYSGAGTAVAVLDTGVDYTRSAFGGCTSPGVPAGCKVAAAIDIAPDDGALDANGHGTNVAAIVLGIAPGTRIVALDVFASSSAFTSDVLAGIDWVLQNRSTYNIVAVNLSLGSGRFFSPTTADPYYIPFVNLRAAGIVPVAAAGNNGYLDSLDRPAAVLGAVSVGAVYDSNVGTYNGSCVDPTTSADRVTCYSNSATFLTVFAPGTYVTAAGSTYSGTSQATPFVAAGAAILRAAFPSESVDQIVARLQNGSVVFDHRNGLGKPRLDLPTALGLSPGFPIASYYPLFEGATWNYRQDGVSGYSRTVSGNQTVNGVSTKVVLQSPGGGQSFLTNDSSGIRQHGAFSPSVFVTACGGNVAETDVYSPPVTFSLPNAYSGQSITTNGNLTVTLSNCGVFAYTYASTTTIAGTELIGVPEGNFISVRADVSLKVFSAGSLVASTTSSYWLARDVGAVRSQQTKGGTTVRTELEATSIARSDPDPFALGARVNVAPGTLQMSDAIAVSGITTGAPIAVMEGEYSINAGSWTTTPGTIVNGQGVQVRALASSAFGATSSSLLTIGGITQPFTVSTAPDIAAPTTPQSLQVVSAGLFQVTISWSASSDNAGVVSYKIYRGGALIATIGNVTSYTDTGLTPRTTYSYTVQACDAAGNCSANSAAVQASTALKTVAYDLTGVGRSDILWRNASTGENYLYPMNGTTILAGDGYVRTVADLNWTIAGIGDFDGDGRADILWRNTSTGQNYVYLMNGTAILAEGYLRTVADLNWTIAGVGDFDGDGKDDILWRNSATGENYIYLMNGMAIRTESYLRQVADLNWKIVGVGDFDGDGKADVLWRHAASGQNYLYPMDGTAIKPGEGFLRTVADLNWQVKGVGDFDGDGAADILWRNAATGENYLYPMHGRTIKPTEGYLRTVADLNWQIAAVGDYDGDGKSDLLWRNASTGQNYLYPMDGTIIKPTEGYLRTVPVGNWTVVGR